MTRTLIDGFCSFSGWIKFSLSFSFLRKKNLLPWRCLSFDDECEYSTGYPSDDWIFGDGNILVTGTYGTQSCPDGLGILDYSWDYYAGDRIRSHTVVNVWYQRQKALQKLISKAKNSTVVSHDQKNTELRGVVVHVFRVQFFAISLLF